MYDLTTDLALVVLGALTGWGGAFIVYRIGRSVFQEDCKFELFTHILFWIGNVHILVFVVGVMHKHAFLLGESVFIIILCVLETIRLYANEYQMKMVRKKCNCFKDITKSRQRLCELLSSRHFVKPEDMQKLIENEVDWLDEWDLTAAALSVPFENPGWMNRFHMVLAIAGLNDKLVIVKADAKADIV